MASGNGGGSRSLSLSLSLWVSLAPCLSFSPLYTVFFLSFLPLLAIKDTCIAVENTQKKVYPFPFSFSLGK